MSETLTPRAFWRAQRKRWLVLTLLGWLFVLYVTGPRLNFQKGPLVYSSFASLLLPNASRFQLNKIFASTGQSDLDLWLTENELFEQYLVRRRVLEKASVNYPKRNARTCPTVFGMCEFSEYCPISRYILKAPLTMPEWKIFFRRIPPTPGPTSSLVRARAK